MREKLTKKERELNKERKIVRQFTNLEAYNLLKDLIVYHKFHEDIYILFGLWLVNLVNKKQFSYLKELTGGSINTKCFYANRVEYQELIQDIILEFITFKKTPTGEIRGLATKISWDSIPIIDKKTKEVLYHQPLEGNHGKVVAFIRGAFINCLYKCLAKSYRGDVNYSNLYTSKKKSKDKETELSRLRTRMLEEIDSSITTPELISKLKLEGFSDVAMFQYRFVYSLGNLKTFTEFTDEIETKTSIIREIRDISSADKYKQLVYDTIFNILNSKLLPKANREFLKCYYKIPTMLNFWGVKKVFDTDMNMFYEQFPEYKSVLKVKRTSYLGKRTIVSSLDDMELISKSSIYKESHELLKAVLTPELQKISETYACSISDITTLVGRLNGALNLHGVDGAENFLEFTEESFSDD